MDKDTEKSTIKINLIDVFRLIRKDKKGMVITLIIFAILGIVVAFTTPKTYTSSVMLAPEENSSGFSGSLSSLASMVGMDMKIGMSGDAIYPELYPDLVSSKDFLTNLFNIKITTKNKDLKCDYYTYLTKHTKIGLIDYPMAGLGLLMKSMKPKEQPAKNTKDTAKTPLWLTSEQEDVVKLLSGNISCSVDKKTSVITISVKDQDPLVAALVADSVRSHLQEAITKYRTHKARIDETFIEKLYKEAHDQYEKSRQLYAAYADANQDLNLQSYKLKEDDLENEMQLKYNIYQQVVEQLQMAKAKVQERTPAFTIVQGATVPIRPSGKSKVAIILTWLILGFIFRLLIDMWKSKSEFVKQI